nr:hypothetical protein CFP56_63466 [Quercus suber]
MINEELPITSVRDLSPRYTAFSEEDDENGEPIFLYSSFGYITDDHVAYFGESKLRTREMTLKDILESLKRLEDKDVFPIAPPSITVAVLSLPIDDHIYVKKPKLHKFFVGTGVLPKLMLQEAEVMEILARNPHPHIVRYRGCLIQRGRIVGIVLDRYSITLLDRMRERAQYFDVDNFMHKLTSAIDHLHSLGLAHNDLTPMIVMLEDANDPVLIDYGSCQPFGGTLITAGTRGWIDEEFDLSAQKNDQSALTRLRKWLEDPTRVVE